MAKFNNDCTFTGIARNIKDGKYEMQIKYNNNGKAIFTGCQLELGREKKTYVPLIAYDEVAEAMSDIKAGDMVTVKTRYGMRKNNKNNKYYPIFTVYELVSIDS